VQQQAVEAAVGEGDSGGVVTDEGVHQE
jgi:hypothetical protein